MIRLAGLLALTLLAGACNTTASLRYTPTSALIAAAVPLVGGVSSLDRRKEAPNRLATIMGGFGNPLKTLDTTRPVNDEVADAFTQGLRVRGLLAAPGTAPFRLQLTVQKFDADMIIGRTARIDIVMSVLDTLGRIVYGDRYADSISETKFFQTGVFADIDDLRAMTERLLSQSVDRLLDNQAFRDAMAQLATPNS